MLNPDLKQIHELSQKLGCLAVTASVLINRNITNLKAAEKFLNPSLNNLRSPFSLLDLDLAVSRIYKAILDKEKNFDIWRL